MYIIVKNVYIYIHTYIYIYVCVCTHARFFAFRKNTTSRWWPATGPFLEIQRCGSWSTPRVVFNDESWTGHHEFNLWKYGLIWVIMFPVVNHGVYHELWIMLKYDSHFKIFKQSSFGNWYVPKFPPDFLGDFFGLSGSRWNTPKSRKSATRLSGCRGGIAAKGTENSAFKTKWESLGCMGIGIELSSDFPWFSCFNLEKYFGTA